MPDIAANCNGQCVKKYSSGSIRLSEAILSPVMNGQLSAESPGDMALTPLQTDLQLRDSKQCNAASPLRMKERLPRFFRTNTDFSRD